MNAGAIEKDWAIAKLGLQNQDFRMVEAGCVAVLQSQPDHARAHNLLGIARIALGHVDQGLEHLFRSTRLEPGNAALWLNSGAGLLRAGEPERAYGAYRSAERLQAVEPARIGQATCLIELGRWQDALSALDPIADSSPVSAQGRRLRATILLALGRATEAARELRALPWGDRTTDSVRLFAMHYDLDCSPQELLAAHRGWGDAFPRRAAPPPRDPQPGRLLRVGFVSPDFRTHACAHFLEALWAHRDPAQVSFFGYAEVAVEDGWTASFRARSDGWCPTQALSDEALAERVAADRIDILVDLAGHTSGNRLALFALRPAPIQLTWLGYPGTTGLGVFDGRVTDALADPPGQEIHATEPLLRLPGFLCYTPGSDAPDPGPPPSLGGEPPTFGCCNAPAKLNARVLDLWSRLLQRTPSARLLLKGKSFHEPLARSFFLQEFESRGVAGDRLEFLGWVPQDQSPLTTYRRVDVALDPFPYQGTTSTCEALWMGVPVVVLEGDRHAGRVGVSILRSAGLDPWIARTEQEYLEWARGLILDPRKLASIRGELRARLAASPLLDGPRFSRSMEALFRQVWVRRLGGMA